MQFAEAQLFGRTGRRCLKVLADFAEARKVKLLPKDPFFIRLFIQLLKCNVPREVKSHACGNVVNFTDACYEREHASWPCGPGGVLCVGRNLLGEKVRKQIIFEAETLSAVLAFILWCEVLNNRR